MSKRNILFVDDEQNILSGLKRMLRSMRGDFEMFFTESGDSALEILANNSIDVVISDMRMPGMDGAELLAKVKEKHPHTIRIVLSGHADEEAIMKTIGITHQYLSKPCDPDVLKGTIRRASSLHTILDDGNLKNLLSNISELPSLPELYNQINDALNDPDVTTDEIARIIEQDIAMSAKILQLVNSSFFGLFQKVETPSRAVKLLGIDMIKVLVLSLQIFTDLKTSIDNFPTSNLWSHSMAVANCAKIIAKHESNDQDFISNCFIGGLLHDIGTLILLSNKSSQYEEVVQLVISDLLSLKEAEEQIFKTTSYTIGAYLIGLWGFNGDIVEAICFHNNLESYPQPNLSPALVVHAANHASSKTHPLLAREPLSELNEHYITESGLADRVENWLMLTTEYLESLEKD